MTRRQGHNRFLICITIAFIVIAAVILLHEQDLRIFLIACGGYFVFLLVYYFICWLTVPKHLRGRPDMPDEYRALSLGLMNPNIQQFLGECEMVRDQVFESSRHQLFRSKRKFPQGVWRCDIEISDKRILAWATSFESVESPVLDRRWQEGQGRFLIIQSSI